MLHRSVLKNQLFSLVSFMHFHCAISLKMHVLALDLAENSLQFIFSHAGARTESHCSVSCLTSIIMQFQRSENAWFGTGLGSTIYWDQHISFPVEPDRDGCVKSKLNSKMRHMIRIHQQRRSSLDIVPINVLGYCSD